MSFNKGLARIGVNGLYDIELCDKDEDVAIHSKEEGWWPMTFAQRLYDWLVKYIPRGMHFEIIDKGTDITYFIILDYPYGARFAIKPSPKEGINDRCQMMGVDMGWSDRRLGRKYTQSLERCVKHAAKHVKEMSDPIHGWGQP